MATPICANTGCSNTAHPKDIKSICYGECGCGGICKNKFYWNNCDKCYKEENGEEDDEEEDDCDDCCDKGIKIFIWDDLNNDEKSVKMMEKIDDSEHLLRSDYKRCESCYEDFCEEVLRVYEEILEEDDEEEECAVCDDCEGKCKKEISEIFNYYENKYIRKEICDDCGIRLC